MTDDVIYEDIVHEFYTDANRQMKGFKAEYFKNKTLSGQPEVIRTESSVDYDWGYGHLWTAFRQMDSLSVGQPATCHKLTVS